MARLLLDAVTAESTSDEGRFRLQLGVSVSRADTGAPVTGLGTDNFRIASLGDGIVLDYKVGVAGEAKWEPHDATPSGCYRLDVSLQPSESFPSHDFIPGSRYVFGLQVRTFDGMRQVADQGQAVLEVISVGR